MSNLNLNKVTLAGRLTADPEVKQTPNGVAVVTIGVAVNRKYRDENQQQVTDFFNVTAWRALAEHIGRYFKKGSSICIIGSLQNRSWTDQQGVKRYATDIIADEVYFVDSRGDSSQGQSAPPAPEAQQMSVEDVPDDDLPF